MSKSMKLNIDEYLTFDKFLNAEKRASNGKKNKFEVLKFRFNLENNLYSLIDDIKEGKYINGKYREFIVKEPKVRIIKSLPYKDRIVHQWYVEEFIKPFLYQD
ncbi:MAG: hypothetical protein ACK5HL_04135 [Bacilli bacterium]